MLLLYLLLWCCQTLAVKDYLFKKCAQSGFCTRNRHFADEVAKQGKDYSSRYSVDIGSLDIDDAQGTVGGILLKQLNDGSYVDLQLNISVITDMSLRLRVDEIDREAKVGENVTTAVTKKRYNQASLWAFGGKQPNAVGFKHDLTNEKLTLNYGDKYTAEISFYPFNVELLFNGERQLAVNEHNLLNVEHYRNKASEESEGSVDVAPEESNFNAYSDNFKDSKGDTLPFGPESVALDVSFVGYTHVYGIPEHADSLSLKDTNDSEPYRLFNVDIFEYPVQAKYPMYGSIPFMTAVKPGVSAGVFWVNGADTYIDIKKIAAQTADERQIEPQAHQAQVNTHWMSENGVLDVILMAKETPGELSQAYGALTGYSTLPNIFSLGYHQSRWNYNDEQDVLGVSSSFDEHGIPCDTIWLDIEYTDGKKYFTWNKDAFPDPDRMVAKLDETGKTLVVIIDPHLKTGYSVSKQVEKQGISVRDSDCTNTYHGHCWPGESIWIDTMNPHAQSFWNEQFANGSALLGHSTNIHLWNDMNEPSVFNGPETSAPKDLVHYGGWEHRSVHNIYGLTYHEATYQALLTRNSQIRPFILTRSFFAGSQRTAAMWTGDNMARWEYLRESIKMVLTMNVVGFPFAGADVGGFFHNPEPELLVRWYQAAVWYPFFRGHSHIDSRRREPYLIDQPYQDYIKQALRLRYKLLPVLYTEFYKTSKTGSPVVRPLFFDNPENTQCYGIDDEFFFGDLLVRPIMAEGQNTVSMYLPDSKRYYSLSDYSLIEGKGYHDGISANLSQIPAYLREGSVLPTKQRYRRSAKLMTHDPYTLYVAVDANGEASGTLYIDDGTSFAYNDGDYAYIELAATTKALGSHLIEGSLNSNFVSSLRSKVEKIVVVNKKLGNTVKVHQNGKTWDAEVAEEDGVSVIRNPAVEIKKEWVIEWSHA